MKSDSIAMLLSGFANQRIQLVIGAIKAQDHERGIHFTQVAMAFVFLAPTLLRGNPDLKCSTVCCADFATLKTVEGAGAPKK